MSWFYRARLWWQVRRATATHRRIYHMLRRNPTRGEVALLVGDDLAASLMEKHTAFHQSVIRVAGILDEHAAKGGAR